MNLAGNLMRQFDSLALRLHRKFLKVSVSYGIIMYDVLVIHDSCDSMLSQGFKVASGAERLSGPSIVQVAMQWSA